MLAIVAPLLSQKTAVRFADEMKDKQQPNLELLLAILISDAAEDVEVEYDDHE